jgi:hypothetical protein
LLLLMLRFHLFVCLFFSCSRSSVSFLPSVCLCVCVCARAFHALGLLFPCFRPSVSLCVCVCFYLPRSFVCKLWGLSIHLAGAVCMTFAVDTSSCLEFAFCVPRTPRMYNANIWVAEKERGETETERGIHTNSLCVSVSL